MPDDSADELILKMQHLEAQATTAREAERLRGSADQLKSAAQKLAAASQREVTELEKVQEEAERELDAIKVDGVQSSEAPAFVAARNKGEEARKGLVKARAKLNFALDQLSESERREYEAFHAEARAQTHGQLAEDPMFNKG
jgi:molybdopterin-guanine dinucleotide biosynthesis protein